MSDSKYGPRILIVDDDAASRIMMAKILTLEGYQVDHADGGNSALTLVRQHDYQLVILDYRMPGMNGVELFGKLREERPEIVGIFLTGYPTVDTVFPAISEGIERVLAKPVDINELLGVIKQFVSAAA